MGYQHRALQPHRRINAIGAAYFVTSVTHERQEYFREPAFAELALCDLWFAAKLNQFSLIGYTILPEHVHLLARRTGKTTLSKFVGSFKRNIARDINDLIQERPHVRKSRAGADDSNRPLQENYIMTAKTHPWLTFQDYKSHFLWVARIKDKFRRTDHKEHDLSWFQWQKSFHDHLIRDQRDLDRHLKYIRFNAVRHKLTDEPGKWPWMWIVGMTEPVI